MTWKQLMRSLKKFWRLSIILIFWLITQVVLFVAQCTSPLTVSMILNAPCNWIISVRCAWFWIYYPTWWSAKAVRSLTSARLVYWQMPLASRLMLRLKQHWMRLAAVYLPKRIHIKLRLLQFICRWCARQWLHQPRFINMYQRCRLNRQPI